MRIELNKVYNSKEVEDKIYHFWQKSGFFNPDKLPPRHKKSYTIVIPPPNITGSLHMGHALNATIQDILIRWRRLQGYKTLWLPGTDHAGIATQNVVEKELKKAGLTRFDLGREKFLEKVWQWKEKYGNIILEQFKKLGSSLDWSRTRFTLDKEYSKAVKRVFLHYYKKGWIYRGKRPINWCPRCQTSLSDLEIEYKEEKGNLWYIKYPLVKKSEIRNSTTAHFQWAGSPSPYSRAVAKFETNSKFKIQNSKFITVATTRPETMLGDTAVAVNPKDERYKKLIGEKVILPLVNRQIPIIADKSVDPKFGTGAVKVTPGHDLTDYEISLRHNLPIIRIINEEAKITKEVPFPYQGLKVLEAREKVIEDLKNQGLLEKIEDYSLSLPKCYRCQTTLEIIPSEQWFLKMKELAKIAIEVVKKGEIHRAHKKVMCSVKFHPKNFEKGYLDWLKNIKDWCISRQIWWGHKIPAWQCSLKKMSDKKMGFHESIVPQVFKGKISTWRLRNHNFKPGDVVAFENSQTGEIFGYGTITKVVKTTVGKINLKDKSHYKTYKTREELIKAFKRHNPNCEVNENTPVFAYTYTFRKIIAEDGGCGRIIISQKKPQKCPNCKSTNLASISDVLDTWFSSALWPFATLGWPKKIKDLKRFYPTDVLSTARDIINLWVARMIFSSLEFLGKPPFKDVYVHPTVLTQEGKRMSKSLGTGIDPMNLIEKYGADATRWGIGWQIMGGQDIRFVEDNIVMGRKFCNKIWNASRFVMLQIPNHKFQTTAHLQMGWAPPPPFQKRAGVVVPNKLQIPNYKLTLADRKILRVLEKTIKSVNKNLESFRFGPACRKLYNFFWHDFCDVYIEESKSQKSKIKSQILLYVLFTSLKLLHPFIPFITEEIYQKLPIKNKKQCLMIEQWP